MAYNCKEKVYMWLERRKVFAYKVTGEDFSTKYTPERWKVWQKEVQESKGERERMGEK